MRIYKLTSKGKDRARVTSQERDELLDYLYENKTANYEELKAVIGKDVGRLIRQNIRTGLIEEVSNGTL